MKVTVLDNQTLLDIAVQTTGKAENFLQIAMVNNIVPTAQPTAGTVLLIPDTVEIDEDVVRYYKANNVLPATVLNEDLAITALNCEEQLYECFKD